ncbi:uncharacterized protein LOC121654773 [Melanotaenia boesemani]|uniref:uncharacterized protein LOC121654773 n=1 Tax=Melanotaenia boesemani TaxID=1250792 RepID=UPI001C04FB28|nr:uncharacterized protein LOC121654773 [Melanotaenia boesemani]
MILMGRSLCLPSPATIQELFSVARDASIIPDISLDPVLTTFLSLDSNAALQHHYAFLQRSMSMEEQTAFNLNLTGEVGASRVTYGGVGIVALALSMLLDQVSQQVRAQRPTEDHPSSQTSKAKMIFGISTSSRIGWIIHNYLRLIPGIANSQDQMAETTELYDNWLKLELLDHYERMTTKKRMSTESMQQWLVGAAFHLHMRIHQVRLQSVPLGSAESLRLSYKTALNHLVQAYTAYLHRNIKETEAPGPQKLKSSQPASGPRETHMFNMTNMNFSSNVGLAHPAHEVNKSTTFQIKQDFGHDNLKGSNDTTEELRSRNTVSFGYSREEEDSMFGLLVIEFQKNVSHGVQHHPCESPAIQQALVTRIMNSQDLERNRNFFLYSIRVLHSLLRQRDDFELKTN